MVKHSFNSKVLFTYFLLLAMVFLSSCSHVRRGDGPPNFYVDETKIPNAVPKVEPLAKYGNMRSYRVAGRRYYTMNSSKHYEAIGTASWYGTMFHAHRTSSGERYNMLSMTAAHKSLPLPTYVEVTNLKNKRKIIVKVNDRGPFKSNRLIDLSYVAAKKLGMLGRGTTTVKIKAIDPTTYGKPSSWHFPWFSTHKTKSHLSNPHRYAFYSKHKKPIKMAYSHQPRRLAKRVKSPTRLLRHTKRLVSND
jgi:rare lipoprotein A